MTSRTITGRTIWGVILVALGTLFLLDQLDLARTGDIIGTWWPLILIGLGGWGLISSAGRNLGALILLLVGVTLQVDQLDLFDTSAWAVAWPVGLIVIGLWMLLRRPWDGVVFASGNRETASGETVDVFALMSGRNQRITSTAWRGGEITAIMGGAEVHLDDAIPAEDARLQITAIMGGVELFVPAGWSIDLHATPLLGGIDDNRRHAGSNGDAPRLRIDATAIMGGVELKDA